MACDNWTVWRKPMRGSGAWLGSAALKSHVPVCCPLSCLPDTPTCYTMQTHLNPFTEKTLTLLFVDCETIVIYDESFNQTKTLSPSIFWSETRVLEILNLLWELPPMNLWVYISEYQSSWTASWQPLLATCWGLKSSLSSSGCEVFPS